MARRGARSADEVRLVPLFPVGPFTPTSRCPHHGPIPKGSDLCCMVCLQSGHDDHPDLRRDPRTDPRPEPKRAGAEPARTSAHGETRKERRRRLREGAGAASGTPRV
ncbi:hypothetical protein OJF2_72720 [Aquisphaera giovannonii]|uniref:Uncharacterized protein n=1 Tax=Aquisphaera giovannonii TaxID=406548 RepID=A0A5B9WDH2_9BACT|nr:hypothetical protein [Aquisphaera giovannonii]QEH38666.1 hypothetical protein OJF2_72720 [Aquisphaera giovannonii]